MSLQVGFAATQNIDNSTSGGLNTALDNTTDSDTIILEEGTYKGNNNTNITINKNITMEGKTKDKVIIDAQKISRIFKVNNDLNVTFINIKFFNGFVSGVGANGGALYSAGNVVIKDSVFAGNNVGNNGGAIFSEGSNVVEIINLIFNNNSASRGGALFGDSIFVINNSVFEFNKAEYGGAIVLNTENSSIYNSTFIKNYAALQGGAIIIQKVNSVVYDSVFRENTANREVIIFVNGSASNTTISNSIFETNIVNGSASGVIYSSNLNNNTYLANNTISLNTGNGVSNIGDAIIKDNVILRNFGNGVAKYGVVTIENNTITSNYSAGVSNNRSADITGNIITDNVGSGINNHENSATFINYNNLYNNGGADEIVNNDIIASGSGNVISYNPKLSIATNVSSNKAIIRVTASDNHGKVIAGKIINFYVNGNLVGNATTNSMGIAEFMYAASSTGIYNVLATLGISNESIAIGTKVYFVTNNTVTFNMSNISNISKVTTNVKVNVSRDIKVGDLVLIIATLTDASGKPVAGVTVDFYVNGVKIGSAVTNSNGIATFNYLFTKSGIYAITANFSGNNVSTESSANSYTRTKYNNNLNTFVENDGDEIRITVTDEDGNPIKGKVIYGSVKGNLIKLGVTNSNGQLIFNYNGPTGDIEVGGGNNSSKVSASNNNSKASSKKTEMKTTGIPIVSVLIAILATFVLLSYRRRD